MSKISVVINTRNEEHNLSKALSSVKNFADEVVVVDMQSEDTTIQLAREAGAKVFEFKKAGYVEPARNFAISKAKGEWILILDADEQIGKGLKGKLRGITKNPKADYYRLPRKNIIFGKWINHSRWWPDYNIRFFKKGKVVWSEIIHSVPETQGKGLDLPANENNAIVHDHYKTVEQYIDRLNRYTTEHAKLKVGDGYQFSWKDLILKPSNEFMSRFFQGEGYKDGVHGLTLAGLQAFSEFVLYVKVWQKGKFKPQKLDSKEMADTLASVEKDLNFWKADALIKQGGGLMHRIKRKLKLS